MQTSLFRRSRRNTLALALASVCSVVPATVVAQIPGGEGVSWDALRQGAVVLFRHADAPGTGDPPGFRIDDCATQRNLGDEGRAQARRIGERFRALAIPVGSVLTSQWCRCRDTAELAFPGRARQEPAFNSFFGERGREGSQTSAARTLLIDWRGQGALVVVTHQVNIQSLTGISPASGEGVVVRGTGKELKVLGRITP
jgi:phosphohistidine phosphatase SixA